MWWKFLNAYKYCLSPFPFQDVYGFYFDTFLILILHKCILIFHVLLYLKSVYKILYVFHFEEFFFSPLQVGHIVQGVYNEHVTIANGF
jgi:hypothetical protein